MIDITPGPIAFSIGPLEVHWYGLAYVAAIAAAAWLVTRQARRNGLDTEVIPNGIILIAIAALIGGRLYHVIDQWSTGPDYKDHLLQIFLPPYSGLGIYGGLFTGLLATIWYVRRHHLDFWAWADVIAPAILIAQAVGRWGNFANQELYGYPTSLPWGILIDCAHRVPEYACTASGGTYPADQHFIPLFLYESLLSLLGIVVLIWLNRRFTGRGLLVGDVGMLYFVWYGLERSLLEFFRNGYNWVLFGVPMAQIVGLTAALTALVVILIRHRLAARRSGPADVAGVGDGRQQPARGQSAGG